MATTTTMANPGNQKAPPEYRSMFDPSTCTRRGLCPVTRIHHHQGESHDLYFEVHGSGPENIVFIMGLNDTAFAWLPQVDHFGRLDKYSTLVFDNRGVGMSGAPRGFYSTGEMAEDVLCLLDHLHWTDARSLHVVGISLGGMIAQELAFRIPQRIVSLSLVVTRAGGENIWANMPPFAGCVRSMRVAMRKSVHRLPLVEDILFPKEWLDSVAEPGGPTNRQAQLEHLRRRMECSKPQPIMGTLGQVAAGLTHRMTPDRLAQIAASVSKVLILSAAEDMLIPHTEGERLKRYMPEAEYQCWEKTGHGICAQHPEQFNLLLERVFEQGSGAEGESRGSRVSVSRRCTSNY